MSTVHVMDHPLIQHKISLMRDKDTGSKDFRELLREIAMLMGYEVTRDLPLTDVEIETPICKGTFKVLAGRKLGIVPILRAGLGMVDGFLSWYRRRRWATSVCTAIRRPCSRLNTTASSPPTLRSAC